MKEYENFLNQTDEKAWMTALTTLLSEIHEVDRTATQIWFRFYPLDLFRKLEAAEDRAAMIQKFVMQGDYELKTQIDSSHKFLYGHRFWKEVKNAITSRTEAFKGENTDLAQEIKTIAKEVAAQKKVDESLLVGITAAGLMTLTQSGYEAFKNAEGKVYIDASHAKKSPESVLAERAKDDSQGIFGFLKTIDKSWTVTYDENKKGAKFKSIADEEIASAAARDQSQEWVKQDERCIEGVIPVECRSAACGTCWVGVLGGQEKLSEVSPREAKQMKIFGYNQPQEAKPFMRLACQARTEGAVSIVIPPWNGVFGKAVYGGVEDIELQPATTSAQQNRTVVKDAVKNKLM